MSEKNATEDLSDPDMMKTLANINNYLFKHPEIKKGSWGSDKSLKNIYPILVRGELFPKGFKKSKFKYMNIGAGDGKVFLKDIEFLQKEFPGVKIEATNRDIKDYISKKIKDMISDTGANYIFQHISQDPLEHYDLIVAKVSLHHIPFAEKLINKLDSKYILIREPDVRNEEDLHMQTVEHIIYHFIESDERKYMTKNKMKDYFNNFENNTGEFSNKSDNYFSRDYWVNIFKNANYKSIKNNNKKKYNHPNNPTQVYRELFIKK